MEMKLLKMRRAFAQYHLKISPLSTKIYLRCKWEERFMAAQSQYGCDLVE